MVPELQYHKKNKTKRRWITWMAIIFCILMIVVPSFLFTSVLAERMTPIISVSCATAWRWSGFYWLWLPSSSCSPYQTTYEIPRLSAACDEEEIAVYVHGWLESPVSAIDKFNTVKSSLEHNGYAHPVIGFSWTSEAEWTTARTYAELSGERLAQFASDFREECDSTQIRLISHSLGTRVVLNALEYLLEHDPRMTIASVHLLGAAVDDGEISTLSNFGIAIQNQSEEFHNKYSPEDNIYDPVTGWYTDSDHALGQSGADDDLRSWWPSTYHEEDVSKELPRDPDGDGRNDWNNCGDNHNGYIGATDSMRRVLNDGAIDEIISDWTASPDIESDDCE
jgi:pimeloyl-ACP methyl ester carboxylesterase